MVKSDKSPVFEWVFAGIAYFRHCAREKVRIWIPGSLEPAARSNSSPISIWPMLALDVPWWLLGRGPNANHEPGWLGAT